MFVEDFGVRIENRKKKNTALPCTQGRSPFLFWEIPKRDVHE